MGIKKKKKICVRAGSLSGRGTSAEARPANYMSPVGEGQIPASEQLLDPKEVGKRLKVSPRTVKDNRYFKISLPCSGSAGTEKWKCCFGSANLLTILLTFDFPDLLNH